MLPSLDQLRYPVGKADLRSDLTDDLRQAMISSVAGLPAQLRAAVASLDEDQLQTPYRPEGWTVRQVVHHVADSHLNAVVRFKLALTESDPVIKPYREKDWALLPDVGEVPVGVSLDLLEALHIRWTSLLRHMSPDDFMRTLIHPDNGPMNLNRMLCLYEWHGRHHLAHITTLAGQLGW